MVLVKYDSSGVQQWNYTWDGSYSDYVYGVVVDSSDNVYVAGETDYHAVGAYHDMVLVKYDNSGVQQWNRTWGGIDAESGMAVVVDSLNNAYLVGGTYSFGAGDVDMVLVKYDSSGVQQWNYTWGGNDDDFGYGVAVDSFDNVYLAGGTQSFGTGFTDMALAKYVPDIYKPIITINNPSLDEKFEEVAPIYRISIVEPNLDSIWYNIDMGVNNYTITQLTGRINQTAWDAAPYGKITIRFYAKDLEGKIGDNEVIIEKIKEDEPIILLIIITSAICGGAVIGTVIVLFIRKRRRQT